MCSSSRFQKLSVRITIRHRKEAGSTQELIGKMIMKQLYNSWVYFFRFFLILFPLMFLLFNGMYWYTYAKNVKKVQ